MGLRLNDGSGNHVELSAPSLTGNVNLTLPNSIGAAGQFLQVGANGVTTWATAINLIVLSEATISDAQADTACTCTNPSVAQGTTPYTFTYQWQFAASGSSTFNDVSGATSQTYNIPLQIGGVDTSGGQIRCVVTVTDSSTPTALTTTSTSTAKTIASAIFDGTGGRPYYYDNSASAWVAISVNGSTTTKTRGYNRDSLGNAWIITEDYNVFGPHAHTGPYTTNQTQTGNFGATSKTVDGIRTLGFGNNNNAYGIAYQQYVAHYVKDNDLGTAQYSSGTVSYMSGTYPGYECIALIDEGFCSNYTFAIIEHPTTLDRKLINTWNYGATNFVNTTGLSTWQDVTPTLPNNEKVKSFAVVSSDGYVYPHGVMVLSDAGTLYQIGATYNSGAGVNGATDGGTLANPIPYSPSGMVSIEEIMWGGHAAASSSNNGLLAKGTDGHLYLVTKNHAWRKILDDIQTILGFNQYTGGLMIAMQDGTFSFSSGQSSLIVATPSFTTLQPPSGITVDVSNWKNFPQGRNGSCASGLTAADSTIIHIPIT